MNIKKEKEDELFDAFTAYWKNDWKNTGKSRSSGRIQIGDSKTYLIKSSGIRMSRSYIYGTHHWVVYKLNDEYDMSNFSIDFAMGRGWKEDYEIGAEFHPKYDISNIKKRRAFIERVFFKQGSKVL